MIDQCNYEQSLDLVKLFLLGTKATNLYLIICAAILYSRGTVEILVSYCATLDSPCRQVNLNLFSENSGHRSCLEIVIV